MHKESSNDDYHDYVYVWNAWNDVDICLRGSIHSTHILIRRANKRAQFKTTKKKHSSNNNKRQQWHQKKKHTHTQLDNSNERKTTEKEEHKDEEKLWFDLNSKKKANKRKGQ